MENVIAIDGPSGSGKSTVAKNLAETLGILYIDTGAMFRALGHFFDEQGMAFEQTDDLADKLETVQLEYAPTAEILIRLNGQDLTKQIREHRVSLLASQVSVLPSVRSYLLRAQRKLVAKRICVMEGRDIGTIVFPQAFLKVFVTASCEVRATRRFEQLKESGEETLSYEQILADVQARDKKDSEREIAPLKAAEDAFVIDTSKMSLDQVVEEICFLAKKKASQYHINL